MDPTSYINGFTDFFSSIEIAIDNFQSFFVSVSNVFIYIPVSIWALILGSLVVVIALRVLGR